jgi:hypothetical protein
MTPYEAEIIDAHIAIENWLGRGEGQFDALTARFAPDFTMIAPTGSVLDYPALLHFFEAQRAGRPGLSIRVDDITLVDTWSHGAALRYRETQHLPGQAPTARWSTVVLKQEGDKIVWRHLHETALPAD